MWLSKDYLRKKGVYSICSSNPYVIEASVEFAKEKNDYILIEATPHQINQFGGYSGMTPEDFKNFVMGIIKEKGIEEDRVILGGDHLGPLPWQDEPSSSAMKKAKDLIRAFVESGYKKIHLDCSMSLSDDPVVLSPEKIAERERELLEVAEETARKYNFQPVYVVGTDVPVAGGGEEEGITSVEDFRVAISSLKKYFEDVPRIWDRIIGFVIMLGIGFNYEKVFEYDRIKVRKILEEVKKENLFVEGHSTDYQTKRALRDMVEDGVRILKVGPALTASFRRGVFLLSSIEDELISEDKRSNIKKVVLETMLKDDKYWRKYYKDSERLELDIWYNLLDRIRYYWEYKEIKIALNRLFENFSEGVDIRYIYQYFYDSYFKVREGKIRNDPRELIKNEIKKVLEDYHYAVNL
ncbi:class II D-tagatose-bisphosphate aldolase non-catalytic subunit [Dictyoglomus thermophilum]|uniref:Tagatose 6 phosphate kinase n=1 Tax=Dictyoglomus thermophilum (strain ATCC 35947 / DSM 3960 / H-6-12) TaxID=309799 RepID=B5YBD7_DICT6|nr:class II D-tagatose-bisphosphate aldolase, non-catalytic subunit [Dictyoglomus thermophilum]ACI19904.1 tagatose 6 phosphate kinase [Dictyoglomus thermophilum H-6-12]